MKCLREITFPAKNEGEMLEQTIHLTTRLSDELAGSLPCKARTLFLMGLGEEHLLPLADHYISTAGQYGVSCMPTNMTRTSCTLRFAIADPDVAGTTANGLKNRTRYHQPGAENGSRFSIDPEVENVDAVLRRCISYCRGSGEFYRKPSRANPVNESTLEVSS